MSKVMNFIHMLLLFPLIVGLEDGDKESEGNQEDSTKESKDDSQDDSNEDEDENDSEGSDNSDSENEDEENNSDEDEDRDPNFFMSSKGLPKELLPQYNEMRKRFQRGMQAASSVLKKAELVDKLRDNPAFIKWIDEQRKAAQNGSNSDDDDSDDSDEDDKPLTRKELKRALEAQSKRTSSELSQRDQRLKLEKSAARFRKNHPDWRNHVEAISDVMDRHPSLDFEEAFALINSRRAKKEMERRNIRDKKEVRSEKPSSNEGREGGNKNKKYSIFDAFKDAKRELTRR